MKELWQHQKLGVEKFKESEGSYAFFFDIGTGKTRTAIECLRHIYTSNNKLLPTLIVSPVITLENWKRELLDNSSLNSDNILVLTGSKAKKEKELKNSEGKILILNYEALLADYVLKHLEETKYAVIICDEMHYIKQHNSKRTKALHKIAKYAFYRIGLTGTPVLNSMEDLWSQFYFLDMGKRLENKFHYFKLKYFVDKNASMPAHIRFPNWSPRQGSLEYVSNLISDISMSVKKSECLDLPPYVRKVIYTPLSSEQLKAYNELKTEFISYVGDAACVATLAITKALRMQQVLCGYMPLDSGESHDFKENPRLDALKSLVEELSTDHKIIIWANFRYNHTQIAKMLEKLGLKYVLLTGDQSAKEKEESMRLFNEDKDVRVCLGNQSVGIGVNLVASDVAIYYSRGFNLGHDLQSEGRNYRGGSEIHASITRYDIVATGTLDERVAEALASKKEIGARLLKEFSVDI